jgi:hypothetical protein
MMNMIGFFMADSLRTKMVYSCIDMQKYLLSWQWGKQMWFTIKGEKVFLSDILFDLLDNEALWEIFNVLKMHVSQPIG